jgi:hypothetical protein
MFKPLSDFILAPAGTAPRGTRLDYVRQVGAKACGLALIPSQWTPPFVVVSTDLYKRWCVVPESDRRALLEEQADILEREALKWTEEWPSGLTFRSSADTETIRDRGAYETVEITADYSINRMCGAIERVFQSFNKERTGSAIAIIVQARVANQISGHLSNERRVSQSINFWMCEIEAPSEGELRFNSQRSKPPASDTPLEWRGPASIDNLRELLRSIGRWCTQLEHGRAHIEWGAAGKGFWLFHLDFEDDQPDLGIDPRHLIRPSDIRPSGAPTTASPFRKANFEGDTGWPKIDKVRDLLIGRSEPFPALWYATGTDLLKARTEGRHIADDIEQISHGGAVCRTECVASNIDRLN